MAEQKIVMTEKNYENLKKELETLIKVKRPEIIERIKEARSHGDLSENAEYDAAREEQPRQEGRRQPRRGFRHELRALKQRGNRLRRRYGRGSYLYDNFRHRSRRDARQNFG